MAAKPPEHHHHIPPRQWVGPATAPAGILTSSSSFALRQSPPSTLPIDFSPPLIAMVVVAAAAFLIVTYSRLISRHLFPPFLRLRRRYRRWRRRRQLRPHFPASDSESPPPPFYESSDGNFYVHSPYGLDDSVIKNIPLSIYKLPKITKSSLSVKLGLTDEEFHDCAVCLLEFEDGDYFRTLPLCSHSFHVDCIDIWLRSHATCPLCRAGVLVPPLPESPLTPLMASRIRPSLDEGILLQSIFLEPLLEGPEQQRSGEIQPAGDMFSPGRVVQSEDHRSHRRELDFLLKRSYSFGFERSFPSERLVLGPATTPYHHQRHNRRRSSFWTKTTPFSSIAKSRVFSFRQQRGAMTSAKSPAFFRRRGGFFPMSESSASFRYGSSRRMKYMSASPMFSTAPVMLSSSRIRCGDPEALISPERYNRR